jgi:hypothetical protein
MPAVMPRAADPHQWWDKSTSQKHAQQNRGERCARAKQQVLKYDILALIACRREH